MSLKRPSTKEAPGGAVVPPEGEWAASYPLVWEFLFLEKWEDGSSRVPGSITLFAEDGLFKACLNDKDGQLVAFTSQRSPEGLFEAVDTGLGAGTLDWRRSRQGKPRGPSKKS